MEERHRNIDERLDALALSLEFLTRDVDQLREDHREVSSLTLAVTALVKQHESRISALEAA